VRVVGENVTPPAISTVLISSSLSRSDTGAYRDEPDPGGADQPMIGTVLMLSFGLPSMTRSLYAT